MKLPTNSVDAGCQYSPPDFYGPMEEPALKDILRILWRRKAVIGAVVGLATTFTFLIVHQLTPLYRATAEVAIDQRETRILQMDAVTERLPRDVAAIETQVRIMGSRAHARRVVEYLRLLTDAELNPALRERGSTFGSILLKPLEWGAAWLPSEWLIGTGLANQLGYPRIDAPMPVERQRESTIAAMLDALQIVQDGDSHVITISATSSNPDKAARLANAVAELYILEQLEAKVSATRHASGWLGERLEELRMQVGEAERAIEQFRAEHDLIAAEGVTLGDRELADLQRQLIMVRAERAQKEANLRLVREIQDRGTGHEALTEVLSSMVIQELRHEEAQLMREEAQLALEFGERHPSILQLRAEVEDLRSKIAQEVQSIVRNLGNEVALARARELSIQTSLADAEHLSADARQIEVQLGELEREAEASRSLYTAFLQRFKETREQQDLVQPDARVISLAAAPEQPNFPRPMLATAGAFSVSLLFGTLLAFAVERLDSGMRSSPQLEQVLGLPCLGFVPKVSGLKRHQRLHHYLLRKPLSAYTEAVQGVYMAARLADVAHPHKVVAVISSLPGEGKTTLAVALATMAARAGRRTAFVDLDFRRPSTARVVRSPVAAGIVEWLAGECALTEIVIVDEAEPKLHVMPIRRLTATPVDLLRSERMAGLLTELRARYDLVVLDSPPALGLTDAKVVAALADKVIFAVQWGTTEEIARNGLRALFEEHTKVAGVVLTQLDLKRHAKYVYGDDAHYYKRYAMYYMD